MTYRGLDWVIQHRIKEYQYDIDVCTKDTTNDNSDRIRQDGVIILELSKILTGSGLERLSYV